jgi:hypothetical protein
MWGKALLCSATDRVDPYPYENLKKLKATKQMVGANNYLPTIGCEKLEVPLFETKCPKRCVFLPYFIEWR